MQPAEILEKYWGYKMFRPLQEDIINSVLQGKDTLALLPTGGGKSICFQVPALCADGICIVISPLIALMKDQVENLNKRGIKAIAVYSGMSANEVDVALDNCVYGVYKFLYLSPERLMNDTTQLRIQRMKVNLFAIDEAHCISQWGYDFRPPYLKVADIRVFHPAVPVLALTATATTEVVADIQEKLAFKKKNVFRKSFERKNLSFVVMNDDDKNKKLLNIFKNVPGCGIIYVRNRRKTQEIATYLTRNGISADFYHAGLNNQLRSAKQEAWIQNRNRVIVATNAFGMGIDKPDVRTVIHIDIPDNLEAYYQEAGRAGRDERTAYAVLLYNKTDIDEINHRIEKNFPPIEKIKTIYQALCNYLQIPISGGVGISCDFDISDFCKNYDLDAYEISSSLKILEMEGLIVLSDAVYTPSRIKITVLNNDLYNFQVQHKQYDAFLKTILRSYEGLFDSYVNIYENEIAKRAAITPAETIKMLQNLDKMQVINYLPQTDKPQIQFIETRIPTKDLMLRPEVYATRKDRFEKRLQAMEQYVINEHQCRSIMLLDYFNEQQLTRCGVCDYCRRRNKIELNDAEFEDLNLKVNFLLAKQPFTLNEIISHLNFKNEDKVLKALQWMIDNKQLKYDEENRLYLERED